MTHEILTLVEGRCQDRRTPAVVFGVRFSRPFAAALVAVLLIPSSASAAGGAAAPPGNSAVDQYRESVPTSGSRSPGRELPKRTAKRLAAAGADGEALAKAIDRSGGVAAPVQSTASGEDAASGTSGATSSGSRGGTGAAGANGANGANGESIIDGAAPQPVLATTAASATVGPLPVWLILVVGLASVALALGLRRRTSA
jgi:hypothetical protein